MYRQYVLTHLPGQLPADINQAFMAFIPKGDVEPSAVSYDRNPAELRTLTIGNSGQKVLCGGPAIVLSDLAAECCGTAAGGIARTAYLGQHRVDRGCGASLCTVSAYIPNDPVVRFLCCFS